MPKQEVSADKRYAYGLGAVGGLAATGLATHKTHQLVHGHRQEHNLPHKSWQWTNLVEHGKKTGDWRKARKFAALRGLGAVGTGAAVAGTTGLAYTKRRKGSHAQGRVFSELTRTTTKQIKPKNPWKGDTTKEKKANLAALGGAVAGGLAGNAATIGLVERKYGKVGNLAHHVKNPRSARGLAATLGGVGGAVLGKEYTRRFANRRYGTNVKAMPVSKLHKTAPEIRLTARETQEQRRRKRRIAAVGATSGALGLGALGTRFSVPAAIKVSNTIKKVPHKTEKQQKAIDTALKRSWDIGSASAALGGINALTSAKQTRRELKTSPSVVGKSYPSDVGKALLPTPVVIRKPTVKTGYFMRRRTPIGVKTSWVRGGSTR